MPADPRSPASAPGIEPGPAEADVARAVTSSATGTAVLEPLPTTGSLCPYLRAADGSHRALGVSREHRCWAVEPPSSLPAATQTDLCLTPTFGRCERFAAAQERRAAGLASDHIPSRLVTTPRFAIPVDPVPVVVDARAGARDPGLAAPMTDGAMRRRLPLVAAGIGVVGVGILGLAAVVGGLTGQPGPTPPLAAAAATSLPTSVPAATPVVTPHPTVAATPVPTAPSATDPGVVVPQADPSPTEYPTEIARMYLVKEGDTYRKLAKRFGVKPRDLRALNGPLKVGARIAIPAGPWVTDAPDE